MKTYCLRTYDISNDAFTWSDVTRGDYVAENAIQTIALIYGRLKWACPAAMRPKPSEHILRAVQSGLSPAEVWEIRDRWPSTPILRDDEGRELQPSDDADDAALVAEIATPPSGDEIADALAQWIEANRTTIPWLAAA